LKEENTQKEYTCLSGGKLMKQRDLVKKLEDSGFVFERHGSNHDIYARGEEKEEVPRHKEIDERLAKAIIKRRKL
jgi:mRNA interferase HicA